MKKSPSSGGGRLLGVFQRTQKGFGFVRPSDDGREGEKAKDVYIPADRAGDAATGDVVLVELSRPRHGEPGPRGRIVKVVERQTHRFVGTYFEAAGAAYVRTDGTVFARPIFVGDPGAKNAQVDDKVVIEMLRFPSPAARRRSGGGRGARASGKPGVDTLSIIREFNLPEQFAEDALDEAQRQADKFDESIAGRAGPDRRDDRDDRPGRRAGFRRRHFAGAAAQWQLATGGPHRRRGAFRPPQDGVGSRGIGAGHKRVLARPRAAHVARDDLQRAGQPSARQGTLYEIGRHGS